MLHKILTSCMLKSTQGMIVTFLVVMNKSIPPRIFFQLLPRFPLTCAKNPVYYYCCAGVAQLVEQLIRNQQVAGSSPASISTSEQAIQLLAPIFYSVRARGFCCCPVDSAVPFYQKLILLFFEKEGICCGRCLPFWVETAIGFFALQRFSCTAEMNAADAGMLAVAGGLNGVRCPVLGS